MSFDITLHNPNADPKTKTVRDVEHFGIRYEDDLNTVTVEYQDGKSEQFEGTDMTVAGAAIPKDEYPTRYIATCSESWGQGHGPAGEYDALANMAQFLDHEGEDPVETTIVYLRGDFDVAGTHVRASREIIEEKHLLIDRETLQEVADHYGATELMAEEAIVEAEEVEDA